MRIYMHIQNIIYYDNNYRNLWQDFDRSFTNEVNNFICNKNYLTPDQLNGVINVDADWDRRIKDFNSINHRNDQIVYNNKNQIHIYNKVGNSPKTNISKNQIKNQPKINSFFAKA